MDTRPAHPKAASDLGLGQPADGELPGCLLAARLETFEIATRTVSLVHEARLFLHPVMVGPKRYSIMRDSIMAITFLVAACAVLWVGDYFGIIAEPYRRSVVDLYGRDEVDNTPVSPGDESPR